MEFDRFIPLETSLPESYGDFGLYGKSALGIRELINSYGGDTAEFREGSDAWWFHHAGDAELGSFDFPEWVFEIDGISKKALIEIRNLYQHSILNIDTELGNSANLKAEAMAIKFSYTIKVNAPFRYYFTNNLLRAKRFIFTNGTYLLPLPSFSSMTISQKGIKLFYYALYFTVLLSGLVGLIIGVIDAQRINSLSLLLSISLLVSLIMAVVFVGDIIENRYFISMYPFLLIFGIYAFDRIRKVVIR